MQEFTVQLFDDGSAQIGGTGANLELRFGYSKNAHMYSVKFIRSKEWEDLYIRVHFHPEADIYDVDPVLAQNNIVNIPAMVTSMPGKGKLTIEGTDGYKTITSADIPYRVSENSGIDSETDPEPGESSFQQFVDAVKEDAKSAEQAAKDAESALAETKEAASLALTDIETARTNAISDIEKIESEVKGEIQEYVDSAKSSAEAASKSAEEAKSAADSAKKSLSDLETAKDSALSDISKEKDTSVSAVGSAKESALTELSKSASSAIQNVKTAETNAIDAVKAEGSSQKTALSNASNAALTSIDSAKQGAVKAVEDKASEESSAIDEKAAQVIQSVQNAGDAEISAIGQATTSGIEQITQSAGQHLTQIDSAADDAVQDIMDVKEDSLDEFEAVNAHPPIQNPETGKWQVYSAETSSYVDTEYDWEGGYYSPSVDGEGILTWQASKEGMDDIPSSNIRGPQGLGVPTPTANDYGKAPTVNAAGTGYELIGPYAPLSAAIIETTKGSMAVCEDSIEWPLQGMRVYGKSTQFTTTGKNLLNISEMQTKTSKGITFELSNGGIYVHGTATAVVDSPIFYFKLNPGTYISNINESKYSWVNSVNYVIKQSNDNLWWCDAGNAFTLKADDEGLYFYFAVTNGSTVDEIIYPQIELGSTATDYEPYTGGKPSPNPDYPQEIVSAGDNGIVDITFHSSNKIPLLNSTSFSEKGLNVAYENGIVKIHGTCNAYAWINIYPYVMNNTAETYVGTPILGQVGAISCDSPFEAVSFRTGDSLTTIPKGSKSVPLTEAVKGIFIEIAEGNTIDFEGTFGIFDSYTNFSINTPNGLPGIPVDSGGNFVDTDGQQRICNYRDYDAEKDIKAIEYIASYNKESVGDIWMSTTGKLTVGASVLYALDTPIETPIPADELAAYRALHAYDGTTIVTLDDELAEAEVDYIVKSKAYIEKKLTAIETRLNALEISEALEGE